MVSCLFFFFFALTYHNVLSLLQTSMYIADHLNHCTVIFELDHASYAKALEVIQFSETIKGKLTGCEEDSLPNVAFLVCMRKQFWDSGIAEIFTGCGVAGYVSSVWMHFALDVCSTKEKKVFSTEISLVWSEEICMILQVVFRAMVYINNFLAWDPVCKTRFREFWRRKTVLILAVLQEKQG